MEICSWCNKSADLLAKAYAKESDIPITTIQIEEAEREQVETGSRATLQYNSARIWKCPQTSKNKKYLLPNGITNEIRDSSC